MIHVVGVDSNGMPFQTDVESLPDGCPICHHGIAPNAHAWYWLDRHNTLQGVFQCPRQSCHQVFIGTYSSPNHTGSNWRLVSIAPRTVEPYRAPAEIAALSPTFVKIMTQVGTAEAFRLDQLVGIGLRKALEFLIKDFAISENSGEKERILQMFLGPCIKAYIPDGNIKSCAERATWLGNDETHYLRKWEDKDVRDLKSVVTLTVNWIHNHLTTQQLLKDMPEGKK